MADDQLEPSDVDRLITMVGNLASANITQGTMSERNLAEATHLRKTQDKATRMAAAAATIVAAATPLSVFSGAPVTTRTIDDLQMVGCTVIPCLERALIVDKDQLDKISKKIHCARSHQVSCLSISTNRLNWLLEAPSFNQSSFFRISTLS
jgi:hypothetical protein